MESIETSIVKGLLYDDEYARRVTPHLEEAFFDGAYKVVFNIYSELFSKYNTVPTMEAMLVTVQNKKIPENVFEEVVQVLNVAYQNRNERPETQWLIDQTEQYCVDKAMYNAIYQSISIIEGNDKALDKHAIPDILDKALSVSFDQSVGSDYFEDMEKRLEYYTNVDSKLAFPLKALNELSNGGLPPKTLNCLLASTNVGKSSLMCFLAGEYLKRNKNVLYISLEMSEETVQERIDANLLDITTDELKTPDLDKNWFRGKMKELREKTTGTFIVKEYPTGAGHAGHFRHLLKELRQKRKFEPDIIFVDYINICASSRLKNMGGVNSYTWVKAIAEELRGLAVEFNVPIMTATQVNRSGSSSQAPDMTDTSESFALPATLDWFAAIVTNDELMAMGRQMICLLKTRYGDKSNKRNQIVGVDFPKMRYYDIETSDTTKEVVQAVSHKPEFAKKERKSGIPEGVDWG